MDNVKIFFDLLARTQGERDIDRFAKSISGAGGTAKKSSKDFETLGEGTRKLGAQLQEATAHVKKLREEFQRSGDVSLLKDISKGERDVKRLKSWMSSFGDDAEQHAGRASRAFGALGGTMSKLASNPYVLGAAAAGAALAAIPVLAGAAGAALAGLGVGFVGLGALGVRNSEMVQHALTGLGNSMVASFDRAASVMEGPITQALGTLRDGFTGLEPALSRMFASVAPHVNGLAQGLVGMAHNAMPGLERAVKAAGPLLDALGEKLPELGRSFSNFFDSLANAGPGVISGLLLLLKGVEVAVETLGNVLEGAAKAWDFMTRAAEIAGIGMGGATAGLTLHRGEVKRLAEDTQGATSSLRNFFSSLTSGQSSTSASIAAFVALTASMRTASDVALGLSGSADAIARSFQRVAEAARAKGAALHGTSEKSFELREAIRGSLGDIQKHGDLMIRDGANIGQVTMKRDADLRKLRDVLVARGHEKAAVESFIATALRVPRSVFTKVGQSGAQQAAQNLRSVAAAAASIQRAIHLTVGISGTAAAYATLNQLSARARAGVGGQAAGGPVRGPGTSTSDSVPRMLSNGEYVIKASSARRIGYPLLDRLNAIGMAGGGRVGAIQELAAASRAGKQIYEDMSFRGMSANLARYNDSISWADVQRAGGKSRGGGGSAGAFPRLSAMPTTGKQIWSQADKLAKLVKDAFSGSREGSLLSLITKDSKALSSLANQRTSVVKKLGDAQKRLADLTKSSMDMKQSTVDKVMGSFSLTGGPEGETATGIMSRLGGAVSGARTFADRISVLRKKGLAPGLLRQLAEAGPEQGNAAALALIRAGGGEFAQVNSLYGQLGGAANSAGLSVSEALYGTGIRAAQALVKGLQSQQKALEAQMTSLATTMANAVKRALGIPGRAAGGPVRAGQPYIVGEKRPELFVPSSNGTIHPRVGGGGGATYVVNVYPAVGANLRQVGAEVVQAIRAYEKGGGRTWAPA